MAKKREAPQQVLPFKPGKNQENAKVFLSDVIVFLKGLPNESVDLIITDPAYSGMNQHLKLGKGRIVGDYKNKGDDGRWFEEFHDTPENYEIFLAEAKRVLKNDSHIFLMFDSYSMLTLGPLVREHFNLKNVIVWDKVNLGMGHYFRRQSEFVLFACKGKRPLSRRDISDVWRIKRIHNAKYPTQKPVELFEAMIASSKKKSDKKFVVCDPFVGSGSSAIAALRQNCQFIGSDISQEAIDCSRERIEHFENYGEDILQPKKATVPELQKPFWEDN
ncbi:MAG: hypothetical protein RL437_272 [Actinomycetota bacterium]